MGLVKSYRIARIPTKSQKTGDTNGVMLPMWKDYDAIEKIIPRFVYYSTCLPGEDKGPHLHKKRRTLLGLVEGKALFVYKDGEKFHEIALDADEGATLLDIPRGVGFLIRNKYDAVARFVNICDYPWQEGDNETKSPDFGEYYHGESS